MTMTYLPPTQEISALFVDEAHAMGSVEPEVYDDGVRVFARALHTHPVEIRPGDAVRGGVALRVMGDLVDVHPFIFRKVCTNGAVMAEALQSQRVKRVDVAAPSDVIAAALDDVRAAIHACGDPAAFADAVSTMKRAVRRPAAMIIAMLPMLNEMQRRDAALFVEMFERFEREHDPSAFGLVNAVTSIARDTADPERRWRIEELGGTMLAIIPRDRKSGPSSVKLPEEALVDAVA
jgi:hypothetical protein